MSENMPARGRRVMPRWPLALIASPAAVAVWSGWVGLGGLCGFGEIHPLPGIWDSFQLNTAITLPVGIESYGAYALAAWLVPGTGRAARGFARRSAVGALADPKIRPQLGARQHPAERQRSRVHAVR